MSDYYENIPLEVRRHNWGWFGEPWPSGICLKQDPETGMDVEPEEWDYDMQKPTPVGERCIGCDEEFVEGDQGTAIPSMESDGVARVRHQHRECGLRAVMGPLAHLEKRCPCYGGTSNDTPGLTRRQEAQAVWDHWMAHGR